MLGSPSPAPPSPLGFNAGGGKKKRRPAGTPDPDAEVVSLSPRTLLESDRYVCEICNQGFQRDQNLQMHRRRHKVPWKLLKREASEVRKRVFVCPEPSCLHHDPCHALGDLVGIKKHFRRKHSNHRQWACAKCSKAYAVQSDYKAHLKTCGTRGHSCDCGRVFSRVESFIEHQDTCTAGRAGAELHVGPPPAACLSRTTSSASPSSDTNFTPATWPGGPAALRMPIHPSSVFNLGADQPSSSSSRPVIHPHRRNELQLLPPYTRPGCSSPALMSPETDEAMDATKLQLSIGPPADEETHRSMNDYGPVEQLKRAMVEKSLADEARQQARRQLELAEHELENAKRIRQQAQAELSRAHAIRDRAVRQINAALLQVTCYACRQQFQVPAVTASEENNSFVVSYMSSVVTEGEEDMTNDGRSLAAGKRSSYS
ncbi:protein indeterminate-domain 16-like [Curcuma longa]|uniref:protein indeterminate-domain 16-like n=1 Tax=Curcuma longa TaxID=136217 RepID=UPI003D9DF19F